MAKIELTNEHLFIIQNALDLYNRIGILQLDQITEHENIDQMLMDRCTPEGDLVVGSDTNRGEVMEIGDGYIKTKGWWSNGKDEIRTWKDIENVRLATDYNKYHGIKDKISALNSEIKFLITEESNMKHRGTSFSLGKGDNDYIGYDMIQVIRHEFWKQNEKRSSVTVDSSVTKMGHCILIKVEVDKEESK